MGRRWRKIRLGESKRGQKGGESREERRRGGGGEVGADISIGLRLCALPSVLGGPACGKAREVNLGGTVWNPGG